MEFNYYFQNSVLDSGSLATFWEYPATISGDFSLNNPNVGTYPYDQIIGRPLAITSADDFTLFFTFESGFIQSPSWYEYRMQGLLCASNPSTQGWSIGLLPSNKLYIYSPSGSYTFDSINLATKNCICIKKAGRSFSVYTYDLISKKINQEQTITLKSDFSLGNSTVYFGYDVALGGVTAAAYAFSWYGSVDQLALINRAIGKSYIEYLFQGFEYKTISSSTSYTNSLIDSSWRPDNNLIPTGYLSIFTSMSDNFLTYADLNLGKNSVSVSFSGNISGLILSGSSVPGYTSDSCSSTGSFATFSHTSTSGIVSGMATSGWWVEDSILYNSYRAGYSGNYRDEMFISHNFSINTPTGSIYRASYDSLYYLSDPNTVYSVSYDDTDLGDFFFDGAYVNEFNGGVFLLASNSGGAPTGVNLIGDFNTVSGLFSVIEQSGYYYYNGLRASPSGLVKTGEYIDLISYSEVGSDRLIYDMYDSLIPLNLTSSGTASGKFYPGLATPYSGDNSYSIMYRMFPNDFTPTSKISCVHNKPIFINDFSGELNNVDNYWY